MATVLPPRGKMTKPLITPYEVGDTVRMVDLSDAIEEAAPRLGDVGTIVKALHRVPGGRRRDARRGERALGRLRARRLVLRHRAGVSRPGRGRGVGSRPSASRARRADWRTRAPTSRWSITHWARSLRRPRPTSRGCGANWATCADGAGPSGAAWPTRLLASQAMADIARMRAVNPNHDEEE